MPALLLRPWLLFNLPSRVTTLLPPSMLLLTVSHQVLCDSVTRQSGSLLRLCLDCPVQGRQRSSGQQSMLHNILCSV